MKKNETLYLIIVAYIFSFTWHLTWIFLNMHNSNNYWHGELIINTNDGYYFASGVQNFLYDLHKENPMIPTFYERGIILVTALLVKILPFSLETIMLYMPPFFSSLIVIPLILLGKLYNKSYWGFLSALLASVTWSFYHRTIAGYYDTDMFALILPYFILYFLIKSAKEFDFQSLFIATLFMVLYPYLYTSGKTISYALAFIYIGYMSIAYFKNFSKLYKFFTLLFLSLISFHLPSFFDMLAKLAVVVITYKIFSLKEFSLKSMKISTLFTFILFLFTSNALLAIYYKVTAYMGTETTKDTIHFLNVIQTISEANHIPFFPDPEHPYKSNVAQRVTGSTVGLIFFIIGYILLVWRKKEFLIALPLVGIGLFAHWGGLRFTVYAVPIAAMSIVYLFEFLMEFVSQKKFFKTIGVTILTALALYPNLKHIFIYNPNVVFTHNEIKDLNKLNQLAKGSDYTLTWWDYGYPLWFYTDTNTIIHGGKHQNDNFIISEMFCSTSPLLAANLGRLTVEEHAKVTQLFNKYKNNLQNAPSDMIMYDAKGNKYLQSPQSPIINYILQINKKNQKDPYEFLAKLQNNEITLPQKTRDIYFYAPLKMINIVPTIAEFSNIDLYTGKIKGNFWFYPGYLIKQEGTLIGLSNGFIFDIAKGMLYYPKNFKAKVKFFIAVTIDQKGNIKTKLQKYHNDANKIILYIKNRNQFIILDNKTFKTNYVQMFLLGNYDKDLFELVIKSPYGRIYKIKK